MTNRREVDHAVPARTWLKEHDARWVAEGKLGNSDFELYQVNGEMVLLQTFANNLGWEMGVVARYTYIQVRRML